METQTRTNPETISNSAIYIMLGIDDPTQPGTADEIRRKSLRMLPSLQKSPALAIAIANAGRAAQNYGRLVQIKLRAREELQKYKDIYSRGTS